MQRSDPALRAASRTPRAIASHLMAWRLPPDWRWGGDQEWGRYRHYQEVIDALGRSLALVTAPDATHTGWLRAEAERLAHRNHPSITTTYHYWAAQNDAQRGPGYLRRWIGGETLEARLRRQGADPVPHALQVVLAIGSTLAYLHDLGTPHGALSPHTVLVSPTGRVWLVGWQWVLPKPDIPAGLTPELERMPQPPEWNGGWTPTPKSDQWQLGALAYAALSGEPPPSNDIPPLRLLQPETPAAVADIIEKAIHPDPDRRHDSAVALIRALDRAIGARTMIVTGLDDRDGAAPSGDEEKRLRWALGDEYEVLAPLGRGTFGSVWRVRDLTLGREVALKMLHSHIAQDMNAVARFQREARYAAQLAHPAIVPIFDWDNRGDIAWYTMELAEAGSVADLLQRAGPRPLEDIAPQIDLALDALAAAHGHGIIHRDLKPENVLIDRYRRWRITDLGIATVYGQDRPGTTGTPAFAAPEQLLGEAQGPQVDCFSFAAVVSFALTGELPFGGGDARTILARQLAHQVAMEDIPEALEAWMRHALDPDPDKRFADAQEMQKGWREAVTTHFENHQGVAWWKRWLA